MRKILIILVVILLLFSTTSSTTYAREKFVKFPALGYCTGTYVRYREDPDTDSEILGRLNTPDRIIILGQTTNNSQLWYEIEEPDSDGTAFVYGKYIQPVYDEDGQRTPAYDVVVNILQNYGINKTKAKFYSGPKGKTRYTDNYLSFLEVSKKGNSFGDISIGNSLGDLIDNMGEPDLNDEDEIIEYNVDEDTTVRFILEDGVIVRMVFEG